MTPIEAATIAIASASLIGAAWSVGASFVSSHRARNGQAQATNLSLSAMNDLLTTTLQSRAADRGRIETLTGVISRAASRLREASGRHAAVHANERVECPFYEQYQSAVEVAVIYLEQAIEGGSND